MLAAALVAVMSFAQIPAARPLMAPTTGYATLGTAAAVRTIDAKSLKAPARAAEDYVVITEQPAGELKTYLRGGNHYSVSNNRIVYGAQTGTIDIVWGKDNKVFFKDIVSGLAYGTWVEGTLSDDGTTITVPLRQNLLYVESYDACVALTLVNYDSSNGFAADTETESVTFTVTEDGVISLQGTSFTGVSLGANWTDDNSMQDYGDYESVYTPYTPNLELVTLPEGAETVEMPMVGSYYAEATSTAQNQPVDATVKVAVVDNEVYIQGLAQVMPEAWVKGTLADGVVTVPNTYLGTLNDRNVWLCGYSQSGPTDFALNYDSGLNFYELDGYLMASYYELSFDLSDFPGYYQGLHIGAFPETITPPEGLTAVELPYEGSVYDGSAESEISGTAQVINDGNDVYIQGLVQELPEAWLKGSVNEEGKLVIPMGQYAGYSQYGSVFVMGDNQETEAADDVVFSYDATRPLYTLENNMYSSGRSNEIYYFSAVMAGTYVGYNCDEMWVAAQQQYEDKQEVTELNIGEGVVGTIDQGESTNAPKYYENGVSLRLYAGHQLTISSEQKMAKIIFTFADKSGLTQMRLTANVGEMESATTTNRNATWTGENNEVIFTVPSASGSQARIAKIQIYYFDYSTTVVELPEDVETEAYLFRGTDTYFNNEAIRDVQVGFKDNYVYIQGLSEYLPEAWLRGEAVVNEATAKRTPEAVTTYVFPNWALGTYYGYFGNQELVFGGATMIYDPAADKFTCDEYHSAPAGSTWNYDEYADVTIAKVSETEATPADPEITEVNIEGSYPNMHYNIPITDVDGNSMVADKLSYVIYVKKGGEVSELTLTTDLYTKIAEDITEIPYNYTDNYDVYNNRLYLNQGLEEISTWEAVGIQSIYRGMDIEHRSNIFWWEFEATAINDVNAAAQEGEAVYFDMQGRMATATTQGILIKQVRDANGNVVKTVKVVNK